MFGGFPMTAWPQMMLLLQMDITSRVEMEKRMAALTETQLNMLEQVTPPDISLPRYVHTLSPCTLLHPQMFPRHIIEFMVGGGGGKGMAGGAGSPKSRGEAQASLASAHQDVTILFMDIVGKMVVTPCVYRMSEMESLPYLLPPSILASLNAGEDDTLNFVIFKAGGRSESWVLQINSVCLYTGFTTMSKEVQPADVMGYLNSLFTLLDDLIDQYGVYKVSCYIPYCFCKLSHYAQQD